MIDMKHQRSDDAHKVEADHPGFAATMRLLLGPWSAEHLPTAAEHGLVDTLALILKLGCVDVNQRGTGGRTALYRACKGGHKAAVELLLSAGADRTVELPYVEPGDAVLQTPGGDTPLHAVCAYGDVGLVGLILGRGHPALNKTNQSGYTPLHIAAYHDRLAVADFLLAAGADPSVAKPENGFLALHEACRGGSLMMVDKLLHAAPGTLNGNQCVMTPLYCAAGFGKLDVVELLVSRGATVGADRGRDPAVMSACGDKNHAIAKLLLRRTPRKCLETMHSSSLFHEVRKRGDVGMAWLLLRAKVDLPEDWSGPGGRGAMVNAVWDCMFRAKALVQGAHPRLGNASPVLLLAGFPHIREAIAEFLFGFDTVSL
jgi:ankyrin